MLFGALLPPWIRLLISFDLSGAHLSELCSACPAPVVADSGPYLLPAAVPGDPDPAPAFPPLSTSGSGDFAHLQTRPEVPFQKPRICFQRFLCKVEQTEGVNNGRCWGRRWPGDP